VSFMVSYRITNQSPKPAVFTVPAGRILAPKGGHLGKSQALVVTQSVQQTVPPNATITVTVPAACIDPPLPPPANTPMVTTTFGQRQRR